MYTINMLSKAHTVKGQGVLSAHDEQVALIKNEMGKECKVYENKKKCCNINHYHTINPGFYLHASLSRFKGRTTVGYVHFLPETLEESLSLPGWMKEIFYRYVIRFYNKMDRLVVVNPYFIQRLESYGIERSKISYIPNFVSEEKFYPMDEKNRSRFRQDLSLGETFTVLCAGQLQKRKGVMDVIELARRMPDINFVWAGNFAFGRMADGYKEISEALKNPPSNVRFLGLVDREEMVRWYNAADLLLLPSYEELFPMTILEAMSCHMPVLVRNLPIYDDILFDYVQREDGIEGFAESIRRLRESREDYIRAINDSARGSRFYCRSHVGKMWKQFYGSILDGQKAANYNKNIEKWALKNSPFIIK